MKYIEILQKDPVMAGLIEKHGELTLGKGYMVMSENTQVESGQIASELFCDLAAAIVGQLLSVKAASTIEKRVVDLCGGRLCAEKIVEFSDDELRAVGLSYGKARCIKVLAKAFLDKTLDLENLHKIPDEEIITTLSSLKGIGRWTAEMFLLFSLGREDIFSHGDQGLKNAISKLYGSGTPLTKTEIDAIIANWKPYRSYASLYLWRSLDNAN